VEIRRPGTLPGHGERLSAGRSCDGHRALFFQFSARAGQETHYRLLWARAATAIHIFFPENAEYTALDLAVFLGIGTAIGAIFSTIVFTASAFSLPMIMDRRTDAITAVITSVNAVMRNKLTMLIWALIIVSFVVVGFATFFIGFIVLLPLIGHATWHAYRETIDASDWPENDKY
jgi:uncharacterized membrane protein